MFIASVAMLQKNENMNYYLYSVCSCRYVLNFITCHVAGISVGGSLDLRSLAIVQSLLLVLRVVTEQTLFFFH